MFSKYNKGHLAESAQLAYSHINKLTAQKKEKKRKEAKKSNK